jgi:hypothetical protein
VVADVEELDGGRSNRGRGGDMKRVEVVCRGRAAGGRREGAVRHGSRWKAAKEEQRNTLGVVQL